jgi:hypothetical protein
MDYGELDPDTLLDRKAAAAALSSIGFKVAATTLATKASRGDGPPFCKFGRQPLYRWGDSIAWAKGRLSPLTGDTLKSNLDQVAA